MSTRFRVLVAAAAASMTLLAACGSGSDSAGEGSGADTSRKVTHAFGEATVPTDAKRVAVLDGDRTLEAVVALGVSPIAAIKPQLTGGYAPVVQRALASEPEDIGDTGARVNVEKLAAAKPDLIVMRSEDNRETYDRVQSVAPTVVVEYTDAGWKSTLSQIAGFLGKQDRAEALTRDYDAAVAAARHNVPDGATMTVARVRTNTVRYMTQNGSFPFAVLSELGFRAPPQQDPGSPEKATVDLSPERIDLLAADRILLLVDDGTTDAVAALKSNPLFTGLSGQVIEEPSKDYLFGNVLTARALIDAVTK